MIFQDHPLGAALADGRPSAELYARRVVSSGRFFLAARTLRPSSVNRQVLYVVCCSALQHTTVQFDSRPHHEAGHSFARTSSCSIAISGEADPRSARGRPSPHPTMCLGTHRQFRRWSTAGARARIAASDDVIHSLTLEGLSGGGCSLPPPWRSTFCAEWGCHPCFDGCACVIGSMSTISANYWNVV